ncbi:uncharacterized protein LOC131661354 [Vicia villosa]|uniref:uncharacterized protein LOC131640141 n=1 Tax=Vicia villosa TaxID=3911 RepID=UPI00273BD473|nr:uncharacterized protein LOC131640141 [Vicia villosa]XP_058773319.1 uncharacterized protein LOC131647447 [Vicia villosa]XP_058786855.1 uncharacterized protein LOC131661354 [Vicia villosa]
MAPKLSRNAKGKNKVGETSEDPQEQQPTLKSRRLTFNIRSRKLLPAKYGNIPEDWLPYSKVDVFVSMCRPTQRETARQQLVTKFNMFGSSLSVSDRMLHLIIAYVLFPKNSNHSRINEFELMVLHALRRGIEVNWSLSIMRHMQLMASLQGGLPYARAISRIIQNAGVLLQREPKKSMNRPECAISTTSALKNTGIVMGNDGRYFYKVDVEPAAQQMQQPPEGGFTMDMMFQKLCSIQTSIDNNRRDNNYEHNLMKKQMRDIQRTQRRILAHYEEEEEGSDEEEEEDDEDEENMDESD